MTEAVLIRELRLRPHKQPAAAGSGPDFTQRASQSPRFLSGAARRESETASASGSAIMSLRLTFCDTILRNAEEENKTTNARSRSFARRRSNPILELLNSHLLSRDEHNGQFIFTLKVFSCHDEIIACVLTLLAVMHALITLCARPPSVDLQSFCCAEHKTIATSRKIRFLYPDSLSWESDTLAYLS